jgi:hypothetical protein
MRDLAGCGVLLHNLEGQGSDRLWLRRLGDGEVWAKMGEENEVLCSGGRYLVG